MKLEWSTAALADLDRFATFLHDRHPQLARTVAREIISKTTLLTDHPQFGRLIGGVEKFREMLLEVAGATYAFQYGVEEQRIVILRVFHWREQRK